MRKQRCILSVLILLVLLTLQFVLTGCDISSNTMTRTFEDDVEIVYYNSDRYVEDIMRVFRYGGKKDELVELGWFLNLPYTLKRSYNSTTKIDPEFMVSSGGPYTILLNDKIDFLKRTMVYKNNDGTELFSFKYEDILGKKKEEKLKSGEYELVGDLKFYMKDNCFICSYPSVVLCDGEYYFYFVNGHIATYKINPEYVDAFLAIAKR